jgi:hypothetical protein
VAVPPGQHHVGESAGTGTSLSDYTTTIGGRCAADGSITLTAGESATCTITNVRKGTPPGTATIEIHKRCAPAGTTGNFELSLDGAFIPITCGATTGQIEVGVGHHQVGELPPSSDTGQRFETTISGDCSPSGSVTVSAGQHATCVVTNTLEAPITPPKPPHVCYTLSVARRMGTVGRRLLVVARVHVGRRPIPGVRVYLRGPSLFAVRTTGARGRALFLLRPHRRGILRVSIRKAYLCPKPPPHSIGIQGAKTPPVTG